LQKKSKGAPSTIEKYNLSPAALSKKDAT